MQKYGEQFMEDNFPSQTKSNLKKYLSIALTFLAFSFIVNIYIVFHFNIIGQVIGNQTINQNVPKEIQQELTSLTTNNGMLQNQLTTCSGQLTTVSGQLSDCQNKLVLSILTVSGTVHTKGSYTTPDEISFIDGSGKYSFTITNGQYIARLPNNNIFTTTISYKVGGVIPTFSTCSPPTQFKLFVTDISQQNIFDVEC